MDVLDFFLIGIVFALNVVGLVLFGSIILCVILGLVHRGILMVKGFPFKVGDKVVAQDSRRGIVLAISPSLGSVMVEWASGKKEAVAMDFVKHQRKSTKLSAYQKIYRAHKRHTQCLLEPHHVEELMKDQNILAQALKDEGENHGK